MEKLFKFIRQNYDITFDNITAFHGLARIIKIIHNDDSIEYDKENESFGKMYWYEYHTKPTKGESGSKRYNIGIVSFQGETTKNVVEIYTENNHYKIITDGNSIMMLEGEGTSINPSSITYGQILDPKLIN